MRPHLHFTADGWINDPHGFLVVDGVQHAFFQYVPGSAEWQTGIHWGHAAGRDLVSLELRPDALIPGDGDDGIWTGSVVLDDDGVGRAFYTSVSEEQPAMGRIRSATAKDRSLDRWRKGPVVAEAPAELGLVAFRDPFVFREEDRWRMLVGGALPDGVAGVLSFSSPDLADWSFDGVAASRSSRSRTPLWTGELWECPQLIRVDGVDVLVFSVWEADVGYGTLAATGRWSAGRFEPENWVALSHGASYYAPTLYRDADGMPCVTFWMRGAVDPEGTWAGAHSLPWVLSVENGSVRLSPHPSVARRLAAAPAEAMTVRWDPDADEQFAVHGPHGSWTLSADDEEITLAFDGRRSSMPRKDGDALVIVDGPIIEVLHDGAVLGACAASGESAGEKDNIPTF